MCYTLHKVFLLSEEKIYVKYGGFCMSYCICRVQKIGGQGAVGGLQIHNQREKDGVSHTNKDIDWSRTEQNYDLHNVHNISYNQQVNKILKQGYKGEKAIRKDAVKLCEALFTSDSQFFEGISETKQKEYFEDCYEFACKRYGKENIVSANVHLDERTPHVHIDFVPLTADGRLSAKEIIGNRQDLQKLQDDFFKFVGEKYSLERGERGSKATHLDVIDYKLQTKKNEIESFYKAHTDVLHQKSELDILDEQTKSRGLFKRSRVIPEESYIKLKNGAEEAIRLRKELTQAEQEINSLNNQNKNISNYVLQSDYEKEKWRNLYSSLNNKIENISAISERTERKLNNELNKINGQVDVIANTLCDYPQAQQAVHNALEELDNAQKVIQKQKSSYVKATPSQISKLKQAGVSFEQGKKKENLICYDKADEAIVKEIIQPQIINQKQGQSL